MKLSKFHDGILLTEHFKLLFKVVGEVNVLLQILVKSCFLITLK